MVLQHAELTKAKYVYKPKHDGSIACGTNYSKYVYKPKHDGSIVRGTN